MFFHFYKNHCLPLPVYIFESVNLDGRERYSYLSRFLFGLTFLQWDVFGIILPYS